MERCINCKHCFTRDICAFCELNGVREIKHPLLMGGSKKCECYERDIPNKKKKFEYHTKKGEQENGK